MKVICKLSLVGPFIVYEYCELGTLKDYLTSQKNHLTLELQELLFRFGLDIAKGMEYLAGKGVSNTLSINSNNISKDIKAIGTIFSCFT